MLFPFYLKERSSKNLSNTPKRCTAWNSSRSIWFQSYDLKHEIHHQFQPEFHRNQRVRQNYVTNFLESKRKYSSLCITGQQAVIVASNTSETVWKPQDAYQQSDDRCEQGTNVTEAYQTTQAAAWSPSVSNGSRRWV